MKVRKLQIAALLTAPLIAAAGAFTAAQASGYAVFTHGASALGQGNAVTAHSDDPSAIFYNPALITKLDGTQVLSGTTMIRTSRDFHSATTGSDFSAKTTTNFPSHFYLTSKLTDKLSAGIGIFNPFGLKSEWGTAWEGRYLSTKSELTTFNINPAIAYRVTPSLSIAAGVDVIYLDATLEKAVFTPLASGAMDVAQKFKGDGIGVGYNVGVAFDITKDLTVGASYRSEVKVDVDGDSSTNPNALPPGAPLQSVGLVNALNASGKTTIKLPQQATAGLAYHVTDPLILEIGLRWEGWSSFKELAVNIQGTPAITSVSRRDWRDALGGNIGARYRLNPNVALLAGYLYGSTPVPSSTFDPTIPDANTHVFSLGTDLNYKKFKLSLAYAYQMLEERDKQNDIENSTAFNNLAAIYPPAKANGTYNTDAHLFAVSLGYRF